MSYLESQNYIHRWENLVSRSFQLESVSFQGPGRSQCACWWQQHCEDCWLWAGSPDQGGRVRGKGGREVPHQVDRARGGQLQQVPSSVWPLKAVLWQPCYRQVLHQVGCVEFRHPSHRVGHLWKNSISRWGASSTRKSICCGAPNSQYEAIFLFSCPSSSIPTLALYLPWL